MSSLLIHIYTFGWVRTLPTPVLYGGGVVLWLILGVAVAVGIGKVIRYRDRQQPRGRTEDDTWWDGYVRGDLYDDPTR